jgi:hypothetical protein
MRLITAAVSYPQRRFAQERDYWRVPKNLCEPRNVEPTERKRMLIVYHSFTGSTYQLAQSASQGAEQEREVEVFLRHASDVSLDELMASRGYIFASPECLASMSGLMKDFFERHYYAALGQLNGRAYSTIVCGGSDGSNAIAQIDRIARGWRLKRVAEPILHCTLAQTSEAILARKSVPVEQLQRAFEMGQTIAAGISIGMF